MLIDVTYVYEASIIAPRKRNSETRRYLATVPVEVPEMTGAELPVAFRFREDRDHSDAKGHKREIHWTPEMGHWQERLEFDRDRKKDTLKVRRFDAAWLESRADARNEKTWGYGGSGPFGLFPHSNTNDARGLVRIEDDPAISRIVSTEMRQREASIREAASGMLLVDGKLFEPTTEPVYEASRSTGFFDRDDSCWLHVSRAGGYRVDPESHYRADELEHMLASRDWRPKEKDSKRIEVVNPEAVRVPLPEMALVAASDDVLRALDDHLKTASKAAFGAYADLRDMKAAYEAELSSYDRNAGLPPDAGELVATLQAALPALAEGNEYSVERVSKIVDLACGRYDAKSLAADFSAPGL